MSVWPESIESIGGFYLDGVLNGERYREAEFEDPVEAFRIYHEPVYEGVETPKQLSTGMYDGTKDNPEYKDMWDLWNENKEADFYFYLENSETDEQIRFDLIPRTDKEFQETFKPFSMMEAKHVPAENSPYKETQKLVFRLARRYDDEAFKDSEISSDKNYIIPEIDLFTAFDGNGGIQEQMWESDMDWRRPLRHHYRVIENDYSPDWEKASESVPMLMKFLPNDLASVGISKEETELAGRHIASAHGINLSFRDEREAEELMIEFGRKQENLVNIDAEFGKYAEDQQLQTDYSLFKQQLKSLGGTDWRKREQRVEQIYEDFLEEVEEDEKDWEKVLVGALPSDWQDELPDEKFV